MDIEGFPHPQHRFCDDHSQDGRWRLRSYAAYPPGTLGTANSELSKPDGPSRQTIWRFTRFDDLETQQPLPKGLATRQKTRESMTTYGKSFADYGSEGDLWITLSAGSYYPDILPLACELYKPVLVTFGQLLKSAYSSRDLYISIMDTQPQWMRTQLCRVFRKYVSPDTPVEMLKMKKSAQETCERFGKRFRAVTEVQKRFQSRPITVHDKIT